MNTNTDLIKVINSYYTNTLLKIGPQKRESTEDDNLYYLSFWGLLRCGYPFTMVESSENTEPSEAGEKREEIQNVPEKVVHITLDDKIFSCAVDGLKERFGAETVSIMLDDKPKNGSIVGYEEDDTIVIPYADFGNRDETTTSSDAMNMSDKYEQEPLKHLIPYIASNTNFPDDPIDRKEYDTFLFNSHSIEVSFQDGHKAHFSAVVYPLYMDSSDCLATDIFAIVNDENGRIRCGMSDMAQNGQKGVTAEYDGLSLIFRGEWIDGRFQTKCKIMSYIDRDIKVSLKEKVTYVVPSNNTSSFYLRHKGKDGTYINVFPLTFLRNDSETGLAPSALIIEDGTARKIYTADSNMKYLIAYDGKQQILTIFWSGSSLYLSLEEQQSL